MSKMRSGCPYWMSKACPSCHKKKPVEIDIVRVLVGGGEQD
jgi:hypothetical protein